jgi:hypothetical protein
MLSNLLALMVGSGGLALIAGAFLAPKLYRNNDLVWGGVALFYGVVLWFCSTQIRGAVLLGDSAAVSLIGWLGWQAFLGRWGSLSDVDRAQLLDGSAIQSQFKALTSGQTLPGVVASPRANPRANSGPTATAPTAPIGDAIESAQTQLTAKAQEAKAAVQSRTQSVQKTVQEAAATVSSGVSSGGKSGPIGDRPAIAETIRKGLDRAQSGAPAILENITGAIGGLLDRVQGRKNPGRRYVRPDAAVPAPNATYEEDWSDVVEEAIEDVAEELKSAAEPIIQTMVTVEEPIVEDPDKTVIEVDEPIEAAQAAVAEVVADGVLPSTESSNPSADEDWDI